MEGSQEAEGLEAGRPIKSESRKPRSGLIRTQIKSRETGSARRAWVEATYTTESIQQPWHPPLGVPINKEWG